MFRSPWAIKIKLKRTHQKDLEINASPCALDLPKRKATVNSSIRFQLRKGAKKPGWVWGLENRNKAGLVRSPLEKKLCVVLTKRRFPQASGPKAQRAGVAFRSQFPGFSLQIMACLEPEQRNTAACLLLLIQAHDELDGLLLACGLETRRLESGHGADGACPK